MKNKIRIFVVNFPEDVNGITIWRMFRPLRHLIDVHGDEIEVQFSSGRVFDHDLVFSDIVLAFRPVNPEHPEVLTRAKELGCKIILDYDDNFLAIPTSYKMFRDLMPNKLHLLQSLALADVVWTSTEHLATVYESEVRTFIAKVGRTAQYTVPKFVVVKNAVVPEDLPAKPNGNTKTVVWRGADFHRDDLEYGKSQYEQILRNCNRFEWVGYMPAWAAVKTSAARIDYNMGIQAHKWFDYLQSLKLSIIWKPLVNNDFNKAKSNISLLEATVAGGICVSNFAGLFPDWQHATKELPKIGEYYEVLWKQAADAIRENYDLRSWNEIRYREILKLMDG